MEGDCQPKPQRQQIWHNLVISSPTPAAAARTRDERNRAIEHQKRVLWMVELLKQFTTAREHHHQQAWESSKNQRQQFCGQKGKLADLPAIEKGAHLEEKGVLVPVVYSNATAFWSAIPPPQVASPWSPSWFWSSVPTFPLLPAGC